MLTNLNDKIKDSAAGKFISAALSNFITYIHEKSFFGIFKRLDRKFIKFLFVGALNTAFAYCIYALLITLKVHHDLALSLQYVIGVMWNFKTTGAIVFKNNDNSLIFKFFGSYIFTYLINMFCLNKLIDFGLGEYLAQAIMVLPIAMLSFILFKTFVFKEGGK